MIAAAFPSHPVDFEAHLPRMLPGLFLWQLLLPLSRTQLEQQQFFRKTIGRRDGSRWVQPIRQIEASKTPERKPRTLLQAKGFATAVGAPSCNFPACCSRIMNPKLFGMTMDPMRNGWKILQAMLVKAHPPGV